MANEILKEVLIILIIGVFGLFQYITIRIVEQGGIFYPFERNDEEAGLISESMEKANANQEMKEKMVELIAMMLACLAIIFILWIQPFMMSIVNAW
jgi:hypothetical protein